jgi:hypothetical protein
MHFTTLLQHLFDLKIQNAVQLAKGKGKGKGNFIVST